MNSSDGTRKAGGAVILIIAGIILIVVLGKNGGVSGLAGNNGCKTNESYTLPKDQLKGIGVSMTVRRCKDTTSSKAQPYVLATLDVDGNTKTSDGSNIKELKTSLRLRSQPANSKAYRTVPLSETPNDSGVTISGSSVAYSTQRRWDTPSRPSQVRIKLTLETDKGSPSTAEHTFQLP